MRLSTFIIAACLATTCLPVAIAAPASPQDQTAPGSLTSADQSFFKKASSDGAGEVQMGQLASQKAASPRVKSFAEQLVSDHTAANQELMALATQKHVPGISGIAPPSSSMEQLRALNGDAFDQRYVSDMVDAHKKAIALFESASHSTDPDVSAFATKTLPTLRHHLQMAQDLMTSKP